MRKYILILLGLIIVSAALLVLWRIKPADSASASPGVGTTLAPARAELSGEVRAGGTVGTPGALTGERAQPAQNTAPAPPPSASQTNGRPDAVLAESALKQIQAFQTAKLTRSAAQHKLDSNLIDAEKMRRGEALAEGVTKVELDLDKDENGRVLVDIDATVSAELLKGIEAAGGKIVNHFARDRAIRAWMPLAKIEALAARDDVTFVRPAVKALTNVGRATSEGDAAHRASEARTAFNVTGAGVKVAVLSDSVDHLEASQASGDLGAVTVLPGQSGVPASGEGTAMLEIVHDLAPGSELYYATAFNGQASFAQNIRNLRFQYGCDIIIDDVSYFSASPFQDGIVARAVNEVTADGALFFSSAGNAGNRSDNQSGTWEGDFVDGGTYSEGGQARGRVHKFGAVPYNTVIQGGSHRHVDLFWADPLGAASNDYDVYVLDSTGNNVVAKSDTTQNGFQDPYEFVSKLEVDQRIVVVRFAGADRYLHLGTGRGRLAISTPGNTRGHNSALNAFCVAAVDANTSYPQAFSGNAKNPVELFSSDGLRRVFFNADGTAITPGNFSSTGGTVRQKPDIAAADGVVTTLPGDSGLNPFFGTSAAAPHAGAIAALIKSFNRALSAGQIRAILTATALDIESGGVDRDAGYGLVMALQALQAAPNAELPTITELNPTSGGVGRSVTLTGSKFSGATRVEFNSVSAVFNVDSATRITTTVPAGATTGRVKVTTPAGTAISEIDFVVLTTPAITGFTPASGEVGTRLTLTGVNFTGATAVQFNGVNATAYTVDSANQISVTVPAGATSGRITVTTPAGTAISAASFTVTTLPVIAGFSPTTGAVGATVTLAGANLLGATAVRFGGVNAPNFTVNSASQISVPIPSGAVTGPISVTTPAGTATSGGTFSVVGAPAVTAFAPVRGAVGDAVTISGTNFSGAAAVRFNGVLATFTIDSASQISATVPVGAASGLISVSTPGGTATSANAFTVLTPTGNDNLAGAEVITGNSGSVNGSNLGATKEPGEPDHVSNPGGKSVWYRWTAPAAGTWQFDTMGSSFDTMLAIYTGNNVAALTLVTANDDAPGTTNSGVTFVAAAGTIYQIAIDGYRTVGGTASAAAAGSVTLHWAGTANAPAITGFTPGSGPVGASVTIAGANFTGATLVSFNGVGATFAVNSATQITAIVPVGAATGPVRVTTPGGAAVSAANFTVATPPSNDRFANARPLIGGADHVSGNSTDASKEAGEPNHAGNSGGRSVWFTWIATGNGVWTFDTLGSAFDTVLAVYTGDSVAALMPIASNDDSSPGTSSRVAFNAVQGTGYRIALEGNRGASGPYSLSWAPTPNLPVLASFAPTNGGAGSTVVISGAYLNGANAVRFNGVAAAFIVNSDVRITATVPTGANTGPISVTTPNGTAQSATSFTISTGPANDAFGSAVVLAGPAAIQAGRNVSATKEGGEPNHAADAGGRSVWYRWTAPGNGDWVLDTAGSGFDTTLGVYTGNTVSNLTLVSGNDDARADRTSRVNFNAVGGTVYSIAVDGYNGDNGELVLKLLPTTAPQTIYQTGFEVAEGFNTALALAGQNGWLRDGSGGNGVVTGVFPGYGQQAYIGATPPTIFGQNLALWWPANYTPDTNSRPVLRFSVLMAIIDSANFAYDDFQWSVFNRAGDRLFALDFDNNDLSLYYALDDNSGYHLTGVAFTNNIIYELVISMDFARNRWSATLDGLPVVNELRISTVPGRPLDLGDVDAVWLPINDFFPGDNELAFDEYRLTAEPSEQPTIILPPQTQSVVAGANVTLAVVAGGGEPLAYQWRWNGADFPGATNAILALNNVSVGQAGTYTVNVSNRAGNASATATLTVTQAVVPTLNTAVVLLGGNFQFTLGGTSGGRYLVEFSDDLVQWQEFTRVTLTTSTIVVSDPEASMRSRRYYRARADF